MSIAFGHIGPRFWMGCLVAGFGGVSFVAQAQINSPNAAIIPSEGKATMNQTRLTMYRYASCVLKQRRKKVDTYLATEPESFESRQLARGLGMAECLANGQLKFNDVIFRAGLYDALYRSRFARTAVDIGNAPHIKYYSSSAESPPAAGDWMNMREFAECAVRKAPDKARGLILSAVATEEETNAFRQITPALSACMLSNMTIRFSPTLLRGYIGEILYRLSAASPSKS
ncbi:hypothetical protein ACVWZA_001551 [Sphingomonas sp. UYAg733]